MDKEWVPFLMPAFFVIFAVIWYGAVRLISRMARMDREIRAVKGPLLRESGWGSALVNGVSARGCVKAAVYENGILLSLMPLFGGGHLWLPNEAISVESSSPRRWWIVPARRTLRCGDHRVTVYGALVDVLGEGAERRG